MPPFDATLLHPFVRWLEATPADDTVNLIDFELTGPNDISTTYHGYLEALVTQVGVTPTRLGPDIPLMGLTGARGFGIPQSFTEPAAFVALHFGGNPPAEIRARGQIDPAAPFQTSGVGKVDITDGQPQADGSVTLTLIQNLESPYPDPQPDWKWRLQLSRVASSKEKIP